MGDRTHFEEPNVHAFDFALAPGTRVLAARAGTVIRVVDEYPAGDDLSPEQRPVAHYSNTVEVLHEDGTFGGYVHLRKGVVAKAGQKVTVGELLGYSGASGSDDGPHLHFSVQRLSSYGVQLSVPIRFGKPGTEGFVPQEDHTIGGPPKANLELLVTFDGRRIYDGDMIVLPRQGMGQLTVAVPENQGYRDVTRAPATRYHSITPWSVVVSDTGRVQMAYGPGYANSPDENRDAGRIMVLYANRSRHVGHITFNLETK